MGKKVWPSLGICSLVFFSTGNFILLWTKIGLPPFLPTFSAEGGGGGGVVKSPSQPFGTPPRSPTCTLCSAVTSTPVNAGKRDLVWPLKLISGRGGKGEIRSGVFWGTGRGGGGVFSWPTGLFWERGFFSPHYPGFFLAGVFWEKSFLFIMTFSVPLFFQFSYFLESFCPFPFI